MNGHRTRLACGRQLLALVQQVSDGLPAEDPEHQASCIHCQRALAGIRATIDDLRALAVEPVAAPANLARRVMRRLRDEQERLAVSTTQRGRTSVNQALVAQIAHRAALSVPEVVFASGRMSGTDAEGSVRIDMYLVVVYGPAIERIARAVRERVLADVVALTGLLVETVDVHVDDLS